MGKQSIDGDNNQTGQMLAALLNWPQGTFASQITSENGQVKVTREVDGGLETLSLKLPAVITTDLRLNQPRHASIPNIMKAKQKPMDVFSINDLNVSLKAHTKILKVEPPAARSPGSMVANVDELLDKLHKEAKVL